MTTRLQRSIRLLLSECYDEEPQLVAEVYTLSSGSWRRVEISLRPEVEVSNCYTANSTATFVSGALHWLGEFLELNEDNDDETKILSFDVNNEKFGEIALPGKRKMNHKKVAVFKGKLAYIILGKPCSIWVMGEYGVHESWNKILSLRMGDVVDCFSFTSRGGILVQREVKGLIDDCMIVSIDLKTLHVVQHVPNIATTFMESLVLLDEGTELSA
ncbi:hypothetical protein CMV_016877 [Castanea mollissima]|uniref:F-box associated beta-propeller type 1 domain-containing protein n=1 Tax=Castanea mollissima TaxID=60419 RepID=A0A8J4R7D6_9ROSI|nr:hypothetical protein CMV_016877 [Castanea mollissima]